MRWLLWLLLLFPVVGTAGTLEHTAIAAYQDIQRIESHTRLEHGGIIVIRNGTYQYIHSQTLLRRADLLVIDPHKMLKPGDEFVAVYHTHPCIKGYWTGLYSISDIIQQSAWKVPSFILDECSMQVHEIDLTIDDPHATGRDVHTPDEKKLIHLPAGRIIGQL